MLFNSQSNSNAIIEKRTNRLIAGCKNTIIPISVTSIGDSAFSGSSELAEVTIPNSVAHIGADAFSNCGKELTIKGQAGCYAQTYAKEHDYNFIALDAAVEGDVDGNKKLTLSDVRLALKAVLKMTTLNEQGSWAADVDGEAGIRIFIKSLAWRSIGLFLHREDLLKYIIGKMEHIFWNRAIYYRMIKRKRIMMQKQKYV